MENDIENADPPASRIVEVFDRTHNAFWLFRIGLSTFNTLFIALTAVMFLLHFILSFASYTTSMIPPLPIYVHMIILLILCLMVRWFIIRNRIVRDRSNS
jgi:NADH:ubiquinone oxidoreductase subunit H